LVRKEDKIRKRIKKILEALSKGAERVYDYHGQGERTVGSPMKKLQILVYLVIIVCQY